MKEIMLLVTYKLKPQARRQRYCKRPAARMALCGMITI